MQYLTLVLLLFTGTSSALEQFFFQNPVVRKHLGQNYLNRHLTLACLEALWLALAI